MSAPRPPLVAVIPVLLALLAAGGGVEILSKSRLERCARDSGACGRLECDRKIVLNMAVPSGSSGGEASLVAQVVEVEENDTQAMRTIRDPPVITINKSAAYALYALTYVRDVAYKPEEQFVKTRKCEPDAGADVKSCERLRDENGHIIEHTEPVCCPCGPQHRVPSSCGTFFDKMVKGKANTAHCLRFPSDWFHAFGIGTRSLGFSIRVQVKKGSSVSEVVVGPDNRAFVSGDNFLRVNLVGDFVGYTSVPSFEDFYLVTPRKGGGSGQPEVLGDEYSRWMLLERVRFSLDGLDCNKTGVGYEAYQNQLNFCSSPFWSCLCNQLWNFWEISRNQQPQYVVDGRFQRINQQPNAGVHTFSVGITEVLNTNLLVELSADDIEYVYQRSPGKIISINVPTFEALSQVGTAKVTTKNIGKLEASYSLTFDCLSGINYVEEQFFIMKPDEVIVRSFYLCPSTDQAAKYLCAAILKASDFSELDRAECQFSTTATVLDNGTQIGSSNDQKKGGIRGFFEAVKAFWRTLWDSVMDFFTGRLCRTKCSSFFDFSCHIQYICIGWLVMFGLLLSIVPALQCFCGFCIRKDSSIPCTTGGRTCSGRSRTTARTRGTRRATTCTLTATATTPTGTTRTRGARAGRATTTTSSTGTAGSSPTRRRKATGTGTTRRSACSTGKWGASTGTARLWPRRCTGMGQACCAGRRTPRSTGTGGGSRGAPGMGSTTASTTTRGRCKHGCADLVVKASCPSYRVCD